MLTIGNAFLQLTHTHTHAELTGKQNIFLSENSENLKKSKWFSVGSLLAPKASHLHFHLIMSIILNTAAIRHLHAADTAASHQKRDSETLMKSSDRRAIFVDGAQVLPLPRLSHADTGEYALPLLCTSTVLSGCFWHGCELLFLEDRATLHSPLDPHASHVLSTWDTNIHRMMHALWEAEHWQDNFPI